jgi:hypothetical protein
VSPGVYNRNSEYFVSPADSDSITEIPIIKMTLMSLHPSNNFAKKTPDVLSFSLSSQYYFILVP